MEACLPALEDVLQQFGERAYLDIELKVAGREDGDRCCVEAAILRSADTSCRPFCPRCCGGCTSIDDQIPLGYICERGDWMDRWRELPIKVFLPRHDLVQPQLVEEVHRSWTTDHDLDGELCPPHASNSQAGAWTD